MNDMAALGAQEAKRGCMHVSSLPQKWGIASVGTIPYCQTNWCFCIRPCPPVPQAVSGDVYMKGHRPDSWVFSNWELLISNASPQ